MIRCWRLDDTQQTLVLGSALDRFAEIIYWGPRLSDHEDLATLYSAHIQDVTGGMLDENPELSICPEAARTFPGQPGMVLRHAQQDGAFIPDFNFSEVQQAGNQLELIYSDHDKGLTYRACFVIDPDTHIIEAQSFLESQQAIHLDWLAAPVFPAPQQGDEIIDFSGRWCGEFQMQHTPWSPGIRYRENRTGRTGHEHFPGLILPCRGATNTRGQAFAFHYGWSGGHRMVAEELPDGRRQIQFGHTSQSDTQARKHFQTGKLFGVFSDNGLNGCAVAFQRHLRDRIVRFAKPIRPVHYNCWEAIYFNHNLPELKDIAERAAALGAERFVLDDGWFGHRDDDTQSLADWTVDERKYPHGLTPLIDHIVELGMGFGIWFEPEMINPNSRVFQDHPDWVLGDKDQILGRQQLALNMAIDDVQQYLFERISAILSEYDIEYIKWDHNRVLPLCDVAQIQGTHTLIDRLRTAFPTVEIESCASGGGRIDFDILSRTQRVWLSDSNDALERLKIQHNAALFLPSCVTGSHVGPRHCHTSGRHLDIQFRAWVAAQRHLGFEMDPRELSDQEALILRDVTHWWKTHRHWLHTADILRLDTADPAIIAEQQLAQDGSRFVAFVGKVATSQQILPRPLPLTGLDPNGIYKIDLLNRNQAPSLSRGNPALKYGPIKVSGHYLMNKGINLPWSFPNHMWVLEGQRQR